MLHPPEDEPDKDFREAEASEFQQALWQAAREGIDPLETGRMVAEAIKANRFWIFTNREFLDEVTRLNRQMEAAFPDEVPPAGRLKFETMRAQMARDLLMAGNRGEARQGDREAALDFGDTGARGNN